MAILAASIFEIMADSIREHGIPYVTDDYFNGSPLLGPLGLTGLPTLVWLLWRSCSKNVMKTVVHELAASGVFNTANQ